MHPALFTKHQAPMNTCFFVSDLHGKMSRYEALFKIIRKEKPDFVFMGGDLLPHTPHGQTGNGDDAFIHGFLVPKFKALKDKMDCEYPEIFIIPGNDDHEILFRQMELGETGELWRNLHNKCIVIGKYRLYGYACVPPTPFMNKDRDRLDISDEIEKGCIAPADGYFSTPPVHDPAKASIEADLKQLSNDGYGVLEIANELKVRDFVGEKLLRQSKSFSLEALQTGLHRLACADRDLKSGKTDSRVLEECIIELCQ